MDKAHAQAQETRKRNLEKRIEEHQRRMAERTELRNTLKTIAADRAATPGERLEAVKLIMEFERM